MTESRKPERWKQNQEKQSIAFSATLFELES